MTEKNQNPPSDSAERLVEEIGNRLFSEPLTRELVRWVITRTAQAIVETGELDEWLKENIGFVGRYLWEYDSDADWELDDWLAEMPREDINLIAFRPDKGREEEG